MDQPPKHADTSVLAGRYALLEPMGSGGAGVVWRAHDEVLDRVVAVKLLHADVARDDATASRFRAEATAAAKLTHPHAVIVYDIGRDGDRDYLVMELVEGATLADVLELGPLPPGVVSALGAQVGRALGAAHARGLVHRDVKPANVLITEDGVAKVADFGIARALGESTSRLTTPGHVMGTARYLAPEQLRDQHIDARADVYALGLLLHQALTGQLPFGDGTAVELASRRLVGSLAPPSEHRADLPDSLDEAIARATMLEPDDRFVDGSEFAGALARTVTRDASSVLADLVRRCREHEVSDRPDATAVYARADDPAPAPPEDRWTEEAAPTTALASAAAPGTASSAAASTTDRHRRAPEAVPPPVVAREAGSAPPTEIDEPAERGGRRRLVAGVVLLALVVAAVVGAMNLLDSDADAPPTVADEEDPEPTEPPTTDEDEAPETLEVVDGSDHDPFGDGEHPGDVPNAFDGDPATTWQTQRYRGSPQLGGLKPGVGIWLDLGETRAVTEATVATTTPGGDFTLYAGDAPPDPGTPPEDWGSVVATVEGASEQETIDLDDPVEGQVWLVWFTSLPSDGGEYATTVSDVTFVGS